MQIMEVIVKIFLNYNSRCTSLLLSGCRLQFAHISSHGRNNVITLQSSSRSAKKKNPFGQNVSIRLDMLLQSCHGDTSGRVLPTRSQYNESCCISSSNRCLTVSSSVVRVLF